MIGPRYGVSGAPAWMSPHIVRLTTVGHAAIGRSASSTTWPRHLPGATASSHHDVAKTLPAGEAATSSS